MNDRHDGWGCLRAVLGLACLQLVAACGGRAGGPSSGASDRPADAAPDAAPALSSLVIATIVGDVSPCPDGYAHPNICCLAAPFQGTRCNESPAPFVACDSAASTSPDRNRCCSLSGDGTSCVAPPPDASAPADDAGVICGQLCGPGSFPPATDAGAPYAPCADAAPGATCTFCCTDVGCPSNECGGGPINSGGGCASLACAACPAGWSTPQGEPDRCCRSAAGTTQCYSQATHVDAPPQQDECTSAPGDCACKRAAADGHIYAVSCDSSMTPECTCTMDGVATKTLATADCPAAEPWPPTSLGLPDPGMALYAACGFPSP